jgi:hypothetical protein
LTTLLGKPKLALVRAVSNATERRGMRKILGVLTLIAAIQAGGQTLGGNNHWTGANTFPEINKIIYVDGTKYTTIASAYNALPGCTVPNIPNDTGGTASFTYDHCGKVIVPPGTYSYSSQLTIDSPYVIIEGANNGSSIISYTGSSGCAIAWSLGTNFPGEFAGNGGLYNIRIDGATAGAGTCGLETNDISAFHMRGVMISNFNAGPSSVGWLDKITSRYNEKFDVEVTLTGNSTGWELNAPSSAYTFGYGVFDVKIENTLQNQTAINAVSGNLSESILHITINQVYSYNGSCIAPADSNGIVLGPNAIWLSNVAQIHIESPCGLHPGYHEISVNAPLTTNGSSLTAFQNLGNIDQDLPNSNFFNQEPAYNFPIGSEQIWPQFITPRNTTNGPNEVFRLNPAPVGNHNFNVIDVYATPSTTWQQNYWPTSSGTLALQSSFTGTRTIGSCTITVVNGIIQNITGC